MVESVGGNAADGQTFAEKLNHLFIMVKPEGVDREYSVRETAARVRHLGTELSPSHLSELRRGIKTNPTARVLQGLAEFFQIPVTYFFDNGTLADEVNAELELRSAMRDAEVRDVALRITGLSERHRAAVYRLLTSVLHDYGGDHKTEFGGRGGSRTDRHGLFDESGHDEDRSH